MTYQLPPEELKQAAEKFAEGKSSAEVFRRAHENDFKAGSNHTMQTISPTLDKALEALEVNKEYLTIRLASCFPHQEQKILKDLAKITDAINDIKKLIKAPEEVEQYVFECKLCGKPFGDKLSVHEHYFEEHDGTE